MDDFTFWISFLLSLKTQSKD